MRAALSLLVLASACAPEVVSGAYLCGFDSSCPEGLACDGVENVCVLPSLVMPFACEPSVDLEPDDTAADGHLIEDLECVSAPFVNEACILSDDSADWVRFTVPAGCGAVEVEARLAFPLAFAELGFELWDLDRDMKLANEGPCTQGVDSGDERRCLDYTLVPGTNYGIKVAPTGEGTCDGNCLYNRYSIQVQLATPG